jgi:UrcA family protein
MYTKTVFTSTRSLLATVSIAGALLAGNASAANHEVTVTIIVNTQGLDLTQPAEAQKFYTRIENAAWIACTHGNRVDLVPVDNLKRCSEKTLGGAARSAGVPMLTQIYLTDHTLRQAAALGIPVPAQIAAK